MNDKIAAAIQRWESARRAEETAFRQSAETPQPTKHRSGKQNGS